MLQARLMEAAVAAVVLRLTGAGGTASKTRARAWPARLAVRVSISEVKTPSLLLIANQKVAPGSSPPSSSDWRPPGGWMVRLGLVLAAAFHQVVVLPKEAAENVASLIS